MQVRSCSRPLIDSGATLDRLSVSDRVLCNCIFEDFEPELPQMTHQREPSTSSKMPNRSFTLFLRILDLLSSQDVQATMLSLSLGHFPCRYMFLNGAKPTRNHTSLKPRAKLLNSHDRVPSHVWHLFLVSEKSKVIIAKNRIITCVAAATKKGASARRIKIVAAVS